MSSGVPVIDPLELQNERAPSGLHGFQRKRNGLLTFPADKHLGKIVQHVLRFQIRQHLHAACNAVGPYYFAYFKELHEDFIR